MPAIEILTGVSQVNVSVDVDTPVPSLAAAVATWDETDYTALRINSPERPLVAAEPLVMYAAVVARDSVRRGYTVGASTIASASLTPAAEQGVLFHISRTNMNALAGIDDMVAMAFFMSVNGAKPRICGFQYIPTDGSDLYHMIYSKPLTRAQQFTETATVHDLTVANANKYLGSRLGVGVNWEPLTPTTGGVRLIHKFDRVPYRPDDAPDAEFRTTQGTDLEFSVISGANEFITQAVGGNFVSFDTGAGLTLQSHEQVATDLYTAMAFVKGNRALRIDMPQSSTGKETTRLMLGNVDFNVVDITEDTSKTDMYRLDFKLQAIAQDYLTKNLHNTAMNSVF